MRGGKGGKGRGQPSNILAQYSPCSIEGQGQTATALPSRLTQTLTITSAFVVDVGPYSFDFQTPTKYAYEPQGTKVCRYSWHSAGSLGWPFPLLKYQYIFSIKHTEAFLSNSTRKQLWFEITKMLIAVKEKNYRLICYSFRHTFVPCRPTRAKLKVKGQWKLSDGHDRFQFLTRQTRSRYMRAQKSIDSAR